MCEPRNRRNDHYETPTLIKVASPTPPDSAEMIERWKGGDDDASRTLLPLIYADLRSIAAAKLLNDKDSLTLQPTSLVHDVFERLLGADNLAISDTRHLLNLAARTMRMILIDRLRAKRSEKHGVAWQRVDIIEALHLPIPDQTDFDLLDAALDELRAVDDRLATIVELRYFVGLSVPAVAAVLGVDKRTVYRDWAVAKSWLQRQMEQ